MGMSREERKNGPRGNKYHLLRPWCEVKKPSALVKVKESQHVWNVVDERIWS